MDGIIIINKEKGFTSHDVVAKMRGILRQRKIGHTGTLDPDAVGVLPVCVGQATKLCEMFSDKSKVYEAVIHLGIETDTEDMTGNIIKTNDSWKAFSEETVFSAVTSFIGPYEQVPPMYSALKVNGRKLYEYARKGVVVERKPRTVHITDIRDISVELPLVKMRVSCSKGTYIRTLCADIGKKLGCGGCMQELCRVQAGPFSIEDSITLSKLQECADNGMISSVLMPVDSVFMFLPAGHALRESEKYLYNGNSLRFSDVEIIGNADSKAMTLEGNYTDCIRIYDWCGKFIGIYDCDNECKLYKPRKLFFSREQGGTN